MEMVSKILWMIVHGLLAPQQSTKMVALTEMEMAPQTSTMDGQLETRISKTNLQQHRAVITTLSIFHQMVR